MTNTEIEHLFSYHPPKANQPTQYEAIREGAKGFARLLNDVCPDSADKSAAIRKLRECVMTANASIALSGTFEELEVPKPFTVWVTLDRTGHFIWECRPEWVGTQEEFCCVEGDFISFNDLPTWIKRDPRCTCEQIEVTEEQYKELGFAEE